MKKQLGGDLMSCRCGISGRKQGKDDNKNFNHLSSDNVGEERNMEINEKNEEEIIKKLIFSHLKLI